MIIKNIALNVCHSSFIVPSFLKVTHTGPGSILTELAIDPADSDVDFYRIAISGKTCSVPLFHYAVR